MSKAKMEAARELIKERKIDEARAILHTVDHPTAKEWLTKLGSSSPQMEPTPAVKQEALADKFAKFVALIGVLAAGLGYFGLPWMSILINFSGFDLTRTKAPIPPLFASPLSSFGEAAKPALMDFVVWAIPGAIAVSVFILAGLLILNFSVDVARPLWLTVLLANMTALIGFYNFLKIASDGGDVIPFQIGIWVSLAGCGLVIIGGCIGVTAPGGAG